MAQTIAQQQQPPSTTVAVTGAGFSALGAIQNKLDETNLLLRAIMILLCNQNDVQVDDVLTLAASQDNILGSSY